MATLNGKLYAIGGEGGRTSIEFFDGNNPAAGWQNYSQAAFSVARIRSSCVTIRTGTNFLLTSSSAHDLLSSTDESVPFTIPSFGQTLPKKAILAAITSVF